MRLIIIGCEYSGTTTLSFELAKWGRKTFIDTKKEVDSFYHLALKLGATNEGMPGPRHEQDYYAYFRDLDGNKICAFSSD